jgi:hypothetical protein
MQRSSQVSKIPMKKKKMFGGVILSLFLVLVVSLFLSVEQGRGTIMIHLLQGVTHYHNDNQPDYNSIAPEQTAVIMFHGFGDTSDNKTLRSIGFPDKDYWFYCYQYPYHHQLSYWLKDMFSKYEEIVSRAKHVILWGLSFGGWFVLAIAQYIYEQTGVSPHVICVAPFSHWRDLVMMPQWFYSDTVYGNIVFDSFHDNWYVLASHGDETIRDKSIQRHYCKYMHLTFTKEMLKHNEIVLSREYQTWVSSFLNL